MEKMVGQRKEKVVILGGGIAGIAASYYLKEQGIKSVILERSNCDGGLCGSFEIDGFWFDYGGHASFTKDEEVRHILEKDVNIQKGISSAINYDKGRWIKHPVQNNLAALPTSEKIRIISDMVNRNDNGVYRNYKEWLVSKYGRYFAENFPCKYTRKYWTTDAENLETKWIGPRMYTPTLEEVLYGAFETDTTPVHYSGELRYPIKGGFKRFLDKFSSDYKMEFNQEITQINAGEKYVETNGIEKIYYDYLISTLPLDKTGQLFIGAPNKVIEACENLKHTSLVLVSLGIKGEIEIPDAFYVYDEDIIVSRGYSTSKFGRENAPEGNSTLQLEVYFSPFKPLTESIEEIKRKVIEQCMEMEVIKKEDILVSDVRLIEYANVIFTQGIYDNREVVHAYLNNNNVYYAGRFADWDYLWVDQTILSAKKMVNNLVARINLDKK